MAISTDSPELMIIDACVLIDYLNVDANLFKLISRHVGSLHIISVITDEVKQIKDEDQLRTLGLIPVEPELEDTFTAAEMQMPTSFPDNLCCLTAKRNHFVCITNDKNLRIFCKKLAVRTMWGLQVIVELCGKGGIKMQNAIEIGQKMHENNPKYISQSILETFIQKIKSNEKNA